MHECDVYTMMHFMSNWSVALSCLYKSVPNLFLTHSYIILLVGRNYAKNLLIKPNKMKAITIKEQNTSNHMYAIKHRLYMENPKLVKNHRTSKKASLSLKEYKSSLSISHKLHVFYSLSRLIFT